MLPPHFFIFVMAAFTVPNINQNHLLDYESKHCKDLFGKTCVFCLTYVSFSSDMSTYVHKGSINICFQRLRWKMPTFASTKWQVQTFWTHMGNCFLPQKLNSKLKGS